MERSIQVLQKKLTVLQDGPADGPKVLALHGWLDNAASFEPLVPHLPQFHIAAVDLPGHGRSEHLPWGHNYHFVDWTGVALEIMDQLEWQKCHVMGHSLGANIATFIAAIAPQRVEKLILIEGCGPLTCSNEDIPPKVLQNITDRAALGSKKLPQYLDVKQAAKARALASGIGLDEALILAQRGTIEIEGGVTWSTDRQLKLPSPHRFTEDQVHLFLKKIKCPVLLIHADAPRKLSSEFWQARIDCFDNIQVELVSGGHHVHMEEPQKVADKILSFMAS